MTVHSNPRKAFVDYQQHRGMAVQLRGNTLGPLIASGLSAIKPSPKVVRTFVLAFVVATGAFWAVMLKDPPTTEAAGPSPVEAFSPSTFTIPAGLEVVGYEAN